MQSILFLYNTRSGRGRIAERAEAICEALAAGGARVKPQLIDFAANPFDENPDIDTVVVAGGDGTVNYTVNRMKERGLNLNIGIIPAGTANDFARALGMSTDPLRAAAQIAGGHVADVDCGRVNGLHFVNIFSFGLFTTTSQRTPDERKHKLGKLAYIIEGIKELRRIHGIRLHIRTENEEFDFNALMALVFNGETAGGFRLARMSSVQDGLFDCLLLERRSLVVSCWAMIRHLMGGKPRSVRHLRAAHIEMVSETDELTDVDGQRGEKFPLTIDCLAGGLKVIVPDGKGA